MIAPAPQLAALQRLLEGSTWLGAELETTYRVLALTIEPLSGITADDDPRVQVLLSPTSLLRASLRVDGEPIRVEAFELPQLPDVVAAMDAPVLTGRMVGGAAPGPSEWPADSMAGRSSAPDGHAHRLRLEVRTGSRRLGLFAHFDDLELRDFRGQQLALE